MKKTYFLFSLSFICCFWLLYSSTTDGSSVLSHKNQHQQYIDAEIYEDAKEIKTRLKDVVGQQKAKEALNDIIRYLKDPKAYTALGAKAPKSYSLSWSTWNR